MLFFSGGRLFAQKEPVVMYFGGSVQGLHVGAPVKLQGVVIGEITDIRISFQESSPEAASVFTTVDANLVLNRVTAQGKQAGEQFLTEANENDLRDQLNCQSLLTGLWYGELDFNQDVAKVLKGTDNSAMELPTMATNFEQLSAKLQNINIESLVSNINTPAVKHTALVESGEIEKTFTNAQHTLASIQQAADNLNDEFKRTTTELNEGLKDTRRLENRLNTEIPDISTDLQTSLLKLDHRLNTVQHAAQKIDHVVSDDSMVLNRLDTSLRDVSRAARALQNLSDGLDHTPTRALARQRSSRPINYSPSRSPNMSRNLLLITILLIAACQSSPSKPYHALNGPTLDYNGPLQQLLGIGPVTLPEYLQRPQVATLSQQGNLIYDSTQVWAEPLNTGIAITLGLHLSTANAVRANVFFSWRTDQKHGDSPKNSTQYTYLH